MWSHRYRGSRILLSSLSKQIPIVKIQLSVVNGNTSKHFMTTIKSCHVTYPIPGFNKHEQYKWIVLGVFYEHCFLCQQFYHIDLLSLPTK